MSATIEAAPVSAEAVAGAFALGGNLQFQTEGTRDHALADLVKASSGFRDLGGGQASVDADGWATEDFTVPLWNRDVVPGQYRISFSGPASTRVSATDNDAGTPTNLTPGNVGAQDWVIDVPEGADNLTLKFTGTNGQVKNLKVIQPDNADGQVWSTRYLQFLKTLGPDTIRVMDMAKINDSKTSAWADRALPTDATFNADGVPWEHVIALANELNANVWIPVPVRASDDYVRQLAALVKANLNPALTAYVEYANETWSSLHEPGKYNLAQAKAEVAANPNSNLRYDGSNNANNWQYRRNARRLKEIVELFKEVWTTNFNGTVAQADPVNTRVKGILGGRASEDQRFDDMLKYIDANYGAPRDYFYGIAGAWYFSLNKYRDELIGGRKLSVDQVLEGMGISVGLYESERRFAKTAEKAEPWGLKLSAYELGVDTMGKLNTGSKAAAHRDARIRSLMERFVQAFQDQGGDVANWYTIGARNFNTDSGAWTVTEELEDVDSPKAQAFRNIRGNPVPPAPLPPPPPPSGGSVPEIEVAHVEGGVLTPLADGQLAAVDFGDLIAVEGGSVVRTFEVRNAGDAPLALFLEPIPDGFELIEGLRISLAPGAADSFSIGMPADAEAGFGERDGIVSITSNDADEDSFDFAVRGAVLAPTPPPPPTPPGPEVTMLVNGTPVTSGVALDLGKRQPGAPEPTLSLTVRNDGDSALTFGAVTPPAGYVLAGMPGSGALSPGEAAALTLTFVATEPGTYAGAMSVPTNDSDENPFTLHLIAEVASPPAAPPPPPELPTSGLTIAAVAARGVPAVLLNGGRAPVGTMSVTLRSDSGAFIGPATITIHASTDGLLDAGDTRLGAITRNLKLGIGATARPIAVKVPLAALPAGRQTLLATVTAAGVLATASGPAVSVEAARVSLSGPPAPAGGPGRPLALGKRATLAVPLQNTGNVPTTKAPATYTLLFTTDGTEAGTVFSTTATGKVSLKPGGGIRPQKLTLTLPTADALPPGTYTVLVRVAAELNDTNGQTVALLPVTVV